MRYKYDKLFYGRISASFDLKRKFQIFTTFMKPYFLIIILIIINSCQKNQEPVKLDKIIFNTDDSGCWGLCPIYHLEIKSDLTARLFIEKFLYYDSICYQTNFEQCDLKQDSSKIGYFRGKIDPYEYSRMKNFIEKNRFDTIQNDLSKKDCNDGLYQKYIFYFSQNTRKEIVYNCSGNKQLDSLSAMLYQIIEKNELERTDETFFLENIKLQ